MIDVSQAVDLDHPHALTFLREDCVHTNAYFKRKGVPTLTTRELFDFVVDPTITASNIDATLQALVSAVSFLSSQYHCTEVLASASCRFVATLKASGSVRCATLTAVCHPECTVPPERCCGEAERHDSRRCHLS